MARTIAYVQEQGYGSRADLQKSLQARLDHCKADQKDFRTVCSNVDAILGQGKTLKTERDLSQSL